MCGPTTTTTHTSPASTPSAAALPYSPKNDASNRASPATRSSHGEAASENITLQRNDVLLGRGSGVAAHDGNQNFRRLIRLHKAAYLRALRTQKMAIASTVIQEIASMNPPGRFLERDCDGRYIAVDRKKALEKTSQALREKEKTLPHTRNAITRSGQHEHRLFPSTHTHPAPQFVLQLQSELPFDTVPSSMLASSHARNVVSNRFVSAIGNLRSPPALVLPSNLIPSTLFAADSAPGNGADTSLHSNSNRGAEQNDRFGAFIVNDEHEDHDVDMGEENFGEEDTRAAVKEKDEEDVYMVGHNAMERRFSLSRRAGEERRLGRTSFTTTHHDQFDDATHDPTCNTSLHVYHQCIQRGTLWH